MIIDVDLTQHISDGENVVIAPLNRGGGGGGTKSRCPNGLDLYGTINNF